MKRDEIKNKLGIRMRGKKQNRRMMAIEGRWQLREGENEQKEKEKESEGRQIEREREKESVRKRKSVMRN